MKDQIYHMQPWDEVLGQSIGVDEVDGYCIARIGKINVILPLEMASKIIEVEGQRIGILRTDFDYRIRVLEAKSS